MTDNDEPTRAFPTKETEDATRQKLRRANELPTRASQITDKEAPPRRLPIKLKDEDTRAKPRNDIDAPMLA
jgi:hypothetical protein